MLWTIIITRLATMLCASYLSPTLMNTILLFTLPFSLHSSLISFAGDIPRTIFRFKVAGFTQRPHIPAHITTFFFSPLLSPDYKRSWKIHCCTLRNIHSACVTFISIFSWKPHAFATAKSASKDFVMIKKKERSHTRISVSQFFQL